MATMESYVKSIVCTTCLSSNRRFVHDKTLVHDVVMWFPKYLTLNMDTDRICWECHTVLVKLVQFHRQALVARQTLNNIINHKEGTLKSLSNLERNKITCTNIYSAPVASNTGPRSHQTVTVRRLSSLTENVAPPSVTPDQLMSSDPTFTDDAESQLTKFAIKNVKEDCKFLDLNVSVKTEVHESVQDISIRDVGKENVRNKFIPIVDMRHISIRNTKLKDNAAKCDQSLDNLSNTHEFLNDKDTQSDQSLDNLSKTHLNDHTYYNPTKDLKKIDNIKDSRKMGTSKKRTRNKKKRNLILKDIRIYNNVIEVDMSETELQELRMKEKDSEYFLAAKFKCEKCIFGYQEERLYKAHLNKHKESTGPHVCVVCELRFREEDDLYTHFSSHYRAFSCASCHFSSRFLRTVVASCRTSGCAPPPPPSQHPLATTCADCDFQFNDESQLAWHRGLAHRGPIECRQCGKRCANTYSRTMHERSHTATRVECQLCHKTVLGERGLYCHMRYTHADQQDSPYCGLCKKFFKSKITYEAHLKTAARHATRQYQCDYCGKILINKTSIAGHIAKLHMRVRRFPCGLCDKKYTRDIDLRRHTRNAHSGRVRTRKHICSECGKAYATSGVLKQHSLIHAGLKPHQCAHCPWRFTQRSTLVTHMKYKHKDVGSQPKETRDT